MTQQCGSCSLRGRTPATVAMRFCKAPVAAKPFWAGVATDTPLVHPTSGRDCAAYKVRR